MNLNAFIPPILVQNHEEQRHTITRKRMERFTAGGQLLSVTDVKTTHYDDSPAPFSSNTVSSSSNFIPAPSRVSNNRNTFSESDYGYATVHTYRNQPTRERDNASYRNPRPPVEREYPIKQIDRVVPHEIFREYQSEPPRENHSRNIQPQPQYHSFGQNTNSSANQSQDWKSTDSYIRKTSILKTGRNRDPQYPSGTLGSSQRVEWREPLDCLIEKMNRIRSSVACPPLQPSVRLADIAAQWARMLALRGEFRTDPAANMNIWLGTRVNESIADVWWDESEEFGTRNFLDDSNLSWVGVASAFSEHHRQFLVVAVYE